MYEVYKHDATNRPSLAQCLRRDCTDTYNENPLYLHASSTLESDKCLLMGKLMLRCCLLTDLYSVGTRLNSRLGHNHVFCSYFNSTVYYYCLLSDRLLSSCLTINNLRNSHSAVKLYKSRTNINVSNIFKSRLVFSIWELQKLECRPSNVPCILIGMIMASVKFVSWKIFWNSFTSL